MWRAATPMGSRYGIFIDEDSFTEVLDSIHY